MKHKKGVMFLIIVMAGMISLSSFSIAAEKPKYGGTLSVGLNDNIQTFSPATSHTGSNIASGPVFDSLLQYDFAFNPKPLLAKSWTISDDGLIYTFKLEEKVKWHDGEPFTSADVKFTIEKVLRPYHPGGALAYGQIEKIETPDKHTIVFTLKKSFAPFMKMLGPVHCKVLPKHIYEGTDIMKNPANMKPIGTGPFKFVEYKHGSYAIFECNKNYWKPGLPYLDKVIMRPILDESAMLAALENGDIGVLPTYTPILEIPRLQKDPRFVVTNKGHEGGSNIYMLKLNLREKPLSDLKVRQAISHALDKEKIHKLVVYGFTQRTDGPFPRSIPGWYNENQKTYPYDVDKANKLLDEAGYPRGKNGIRFKLGSDIVSGHRGLTKLSEVFREQLKAVGIDVVLQAHDMPSFVDKVYIKWDSDSSHMAHGMQFDPCVGWARYLITSQIKRQPFVNCGGYSNPKVDELFQKATVETDENKRVQYYHEIQAIIAEDIPILWFFNLPSPTTYNADFVGFPMGPAMFAENYATIWWKKGRDKP